GEIFMHLRRQSNGQTILLVDSLRLGGGGEGDVYALPEDSASVAKIYHRPTPERARKLEVMRSSPPDDPGRASGQPSIAWPTDLLAPADASASICGFVMPRVSGMCPVFDYYNPLTRRQQCPLFSYRYLHHAAR